MLNRDRAVEDKKLQAPSTNSVRRIISPPALAMFFQVPVFDKLPNMLFNRIAIGIERRRNKCYADAAVFLCQLILVSFNDSFVGTVLNEIIAFSKQY